MEGVRKSGQFAARRRGLNFSSAFRRCPSGRCTAPIWSHRGHCSWAWTRRPSGSGPWDQKERKEPVGARVGGVKGLQGHARMCKNCARVSGHALTSKFMEMGGLAHFFLSLVGSSSISALIWDSFIPAMRLILQKHRDRLSETANTF